MLSIWNFMIDSPGVVPVDYHENSILNMMNTSYIVVVVFIMLSLKLSVEILFNSREDNQEDYFPTVLCVFYNSKGY
ncbi:hypothetical protein [Paenibacillus roseipurpureus]|uniref:Uncharacterized protein n=1 Tax=Paenibacillus roseopurpureus TaxID=2918901 RepID=A0AA96LL87_9BACL|nr:hypothetical protein [Paenibacillus sp. MBLB1832]WNR43019.1 hypothetical protein MJB10_18095 [Paenibacillus sp. MBLB1832]